MDITLSTVEPSQINDKLVFVPSFSVVKSLVLRDKDVKSFPEISFDEVASYIQQLFWTGLGSNFKHASPLSCVEFSLHYTLLFINVFSPYFLLSSNVMSPRYVQNPLMKIKLLMALRITQ